MTFSRPSLALALILFAAIDVEGRGIGYRPERPSSDYSPRRPTAPPPSEYPPRRPAAASSEYPTRRPVASPYSILKRPSLPKPEPRPTKTKSRRTRRPSRRPSAAAQKTPAYNPFQANRNRGGPPPKEYAPPPPRNQYKDDGGYPKHAEGQRYEEERREEKRYDNRYEQEDRRGGKGNRKPSQGQGYSAQNSGQNHRYEEDERRVESSRYEGDQRGSGRQRYRPRGQAQKKAPRPSFKLSPPLPDVRQRHLVPPRNIPRFKKYFPKKVCECSYPENPLKRKKTKKIGQKKGKYPSTNHRNVIPGTETVTAFTYRLPHHLKVAQFNERQHLKRGQEIEKTNFVKQGGNQNPYLTQALLRKQQDEQESLANNQINEALEEQKEAILDQVSSVEDEEESDDEEQSEEEDDYEAGGESNVSEVFVTNPNIVMAQGQQGFNGIPDDVTLPSFNAQFDERDLYQATGGNLGPDEVVLNEPVIDSHNGRPNKDRATTLTQTFRADESSASDFILPTFDIRGGTMDDMMTAPSHWSRCPDTPNYATDDGKQYLLTSLEPGCPKMTWGDALDFCQKHAGMQAVAFQKGKNSNRIAAILGLVGKIDTKLGSFWTSGYIRHARKQGDQTTINWNTVDRRNEVVARGSNYWDKDGPMGEPQPDNYAFRMGLSKDREKCAVAHRNARTQAAALHDELCDRKFHVVCEAAYMDIMGLGAFSTASGDMM